MPLYEYRCRNCGVNFEKIQKFSDPPVADCPACGGRVERLLSPPAIQFKGSGWYITDYARKSASEKTAESAKPEAEKKPAAAEATSSEKPAAK